MWNVQETSAKGTFGNHSGLDSLAVAAVKAGKNHTSENFLYNSRTRHIIPNSFYIDGLFRLTSTFMRKLFIGD